MQTNKYDFIVTDRIGWNNHLKHITTEKYELGGKGWYFRFDYDNKMRYEYIVSIT